MTALWRGSRFMIAVLAVCLQALLPFAAAPAAADPLRGLLAQCGAAHGPAGHGKGKSDPAQVAHCMACCVGLAAALAPAPASPPMPRLLGAAQSDPQPMVFATLRFRPAYASRAPPTHRMSLVFIR